MYTKGTPDNNAFSPFQYYLKDTSSKSASYAGWSINKVSELGVTPPIPKVSELDTEGIRSGIGKYPIID